MKYFKYYISILIILLLIFFIFSNNNIEKFDNIDFPKLYYINLENRKDRKKNLLKQLATINYPVNKIHRINAIKKSDGATGCGLSHIKALKLALKENKKSDCVIIMEDDFEWKIENPYYILSNALNSNINWNVILLSCNGKINTYDKNLQKVTKCQTASGYIIKVKYIPILLKIWERDMNYRLENNIKIGDKNYHKTCIDQSWKILQKDAWFSTNPIIGKQMKSFSDIENKMVNYGV
jgi:glycosyl transferase family 25